MTKTKKPHAKLYGSARWSRLRRAALARDGWICRFCGVLLQEGRGDDGGPAAVVDHVRPHRGDAGLFYDLDNLQSLCKPCHDQHKQAIEARGYDAAPGLDGWPVDPAHPAA